MQFDLSQARAWLRGMAAAGPGGAPPARDLVGALRARLGGEGRP